MSRKRAEQAQQDTYVRRLGPPGPSVSDQAHAGSKAAQAVLEEVEGLTDYVANVVDRMRTAVLYGVDVDLGGPEDTEETGLRNLTEADAGAIVGVMRTLQVTLANVDTAVARIVGKPTIGATPRDQWPVSL